MVGTDGLLTWHAPSAAKLRTSVPVRTKFISLLLRYKRMKRAARLFVRFRRYDTQQASSSAVRHALFSIPLRVMITT
jgi:hypothetical protein